MKWMCDDSPERSSTVEVEPSRPLFDSVIAARNHPGPIKPYPAHMICFGGRSWLDRFKKRVLFQDGGMVLSENSGVVK